MEKREGDWNCEKCKDVQFARNLNCRKCGKARPGSGAPDHKKKKKTSLIKRPGDWFCSDCGTHQFASRSECRSCGKSKVSIVMTPMEIKALFDEWSNRPQADPGPTKINKLTTVSN